MGGRRQEWQWAWVDGRIVVRGERVEAVELELLIERHNRLAAELGAGIAI